MIEDAETTPAPATPAELLAPEAALSTKELVALDSGEQLERRDAGSYVFDPGAFAHAQNVAKALAASDLLPQHLRSERAATTIANCLFLVADAMRFRMPAHSLMRECYPLPGGGGLAYQGKLIAGVINKFLNVRLNYRYTGSGEDRACAAFATIPGETEERTTTPVIYKKAVTKGKDGTVKPAWLIDPDQKLSYNAALKWARMHAPELVTGVVTADEADAMAEERRAMLPATPVPESTPESLRRFVEDTPTPAPVTETRQEVSAVGVGSTAPPADQTSEPPGAAPSPDTIPRERVDALQKLAKENKVSLDELQVICRRVTGGHRPTVVHLLVSDIPEVLQQILDAGKDRRRGA